MSANFNQLVDYFGFESAALKLISSNDGATRNITEVVHTGPIDAEELAAELFNPMCVYEVIADVNLSVVLGNMSNISAMITSAEVRTRSGESPKVIIRGTANEGRAAINKFTFACAISKRHRAQNLLSAVSSIETAMSVTAAASVTPVVPFEAGAPCASDVVKGKVIVTVDAYGTPPTANASAGFSRLDKPLAGKAADYRTTMAQFWKKLAVNT